MNYKEIIDNQIKVLEKVQMESYETKHQIEIAKTILDLSVTADSLREMQI